MLVGRRVLTLLIILILMILIASCDEAKRHKMLTYFFDGVPPLKDPNAVDLVIVSDTNSEYPVFGSGEVKRIKRAHGPGRDCKLCHKKLVKSRWATPQVVKGIPEICFDCHDTYTDPQYYVHGPVAVGQCGFCHDPHDSDYKALLKDSVPRLCYRCHDQSSIESIPSHDKDTISGCNLCHEAHSSSKKKLLKS